MQLQKYTWSELWSADLPPIIIWAAPVMFSLVFLEWYIRYYRKNRDYDGKDLLCATLMGIGNIITSSLSKIFTFYLVWLAYYYIAPWTIPPTWWSYILCLIGIDFARYWSHRIAHEQRFWWATHVPHHSSKMYYFGVSFRLSWVQQLKIIFFLPVVALGFDPIVFFICHQFEVLYQFWIHTEGIKKLPRFIEYIFVTPSHHRVHHGTNPQYIDKNYGSTLVIWDRMFGTFEPEVEKPVYGITKEVNSYNPAFWVFFEFAEMFRDMKKVPRFGNKLKLLFSLPGSTFDHQKRRFVRDEQTNS